MADVTDRYNLEFQTNANQAASQVRTLQQTLDQMGRTGELSSKGLNQVSRALSNVEKALTGVGASVKTKVLTPFQEMQREMRKVSNEIGKSARDYVVAGGTDPVGRAAGSLSVEEARRNLAILKAAHLGVAEASYERIRIAERAAAAEARAAEQQRRSLQGLATARNNLSDASMQERWAGMTRLEAATERVTHAQNTLTAAQKSYDNLPATASTERQARVTQRLADSKIRMIAATREQAAAQKAADAAMANTASSSAPALRYAMYDVARTAGMASAAITALGVSTLGMAATWERAFTDVERTSEGVGSAGLDELRQSLVQMSQEIPVAFTELSKIASLGNQLGIDPSGIEAFTETVSRFSTVSGVSAEETAQAFGSMGEIMDVSAGEFENLGSSIAYVARTSVATDAEILSLTREISQQATSAGFAADEVVGLSGAMASLRLPPERSRGALTTYFQTLNQAVAEGGDKLESFASLVGRTSEQLSQDVVGGKGAEIFRDFIGGLSEMNTVEAATQLDELGLAQLRVSDTFQRLSQNINVYDDALAGSAESWAQGSELANQYGMVVDDLVSKWQIFVNALMEAGASAGAALAPIAKALLDVITPIVQGFSTFINSGFGKGFMVVAGALGAIAAALTGVVAVGALFVASVAAGRFALEQLGAAGLRGAFSMKTLQTSLVSAGLSARGAAIGIGTIRTALISTGIGAAVVLIGSLVSALGNAQDQAQQTTAAVDAFFNGGAGLGGAISEDMAAYQAALAEGNTEVADSFIVLGSATNALSTANDENRAGMQAAADLLGVVETGTDGVTRAVEDQTVVLGENAFEWLNNSLIQSEAFQALAQDADFAAQWAASGLTMRDVMEVAAQEGEQGVLDMFIRMGEASNNGAGFFLNGIASFFSRIWSTITNFFSELGPYIANQWEAIWSGNFARLNDLRIDFYRQLSSNTSDIWNTPVLNKQVKNFAKAASGLVTQAREVGSSSRDAAKGLEDMGSGAEKGGKGVEGAAKKAKEAAKEIYTLTDYARDLSSVWGRAFEIRFSGQQTIDAVRDSFQKLRDAAEQSAKRIRDIRASINSLKGDISGLKSDISILEYYLSIAREYGDTKRATALEAELAKKRAELVEKTNDLADKNKELKKEQDSQNKTLKGNSQAARDNRKALLDLVQQYQTHIGALAASGMSQKDLAIATERLRQDFIKQATQLGYNRSEVMRYAKAFDDVRIAVSKVPRNITVKANTKPAQQALNEMNARLNTTNRSLTNLRNNATKGLNVPVNTSGVNKAALKVKLLSDLVAAQRAFANSNPNSREHDRLAQRVRTIQGSIDRLGYATGGYTGQGGKYEPAGIVHRGEYVIPKQDVNQATGLPYADALGRLMNGVPSRTVAPAATGSTGGAATVNLSPGSVQALAHAIKPYLFIDGKMVADASSKSYAQQNTVGAY